MILKEIHATLVAGEAWLLGFPEDEKKNFLSLSLAIKLARYILEKENFAPDYLTSNEECSEFPSPSMLEKMGYVGIMDFVSDKNISDSALRALYRKNPKFKECLIKSHDRLYVQPEKTMEALKTVTVFKNRMEKGIFERTPIPEGEFDA
jgi:hypothetical protein